MQGAGVDISRSIRVARRDKNKGPGVILRLPASKHN